MSQHRLVVKSLILILVLLSVRCTADQDLEPGEMAGVTLEELVRLDFVDAPTLPSEGGIVEWDEVNGIVAFVDARVPHEILLFSGNGQFEQTLGGSGEGPGEYDRIEAMTFDQDARLWVVSRMGTRVDVYSQEFALDRSFTLDRRVVKVRPLGEAPLVVVTSGPGGPDVELLRSDGSLDPVGIGLPENADGELIAIATDGESRYWVAAPHEFRILAGDELGGEAQMAMEEPEWFTATYPGDFQEEFAGFLDTRGATILALEYDLEEDVLWAVAGVPTRDVDVPRVRQAFLGEDAELLAELPAMLIDHVMIGVDPGTEDVIAEERFDFRPVSLRSNQQYEVSEDGAISIVRPVVVR